MRSTPRPGAARSSVRRGLVAAAVLALGSTAAVATATSASAAVACKVTYSASEWQGGMSANLTIQNLGDALNGWTLTFTFPNSSQRVSQGWSATWSQSGSNVSAAALDWNKSLSGGASASIGFNGSWSGSNPAPTDFKINGVACNGTPQNSPSSSPTRSPDTSPSPRTSPSTSPSANVSPSVSPSASPSTSPSTQPGTHVDNPYAGATGYVNPDWSSKAAAEPGGSRVSNISTGIWLDRIAAIEGSSSAMGLRAHLDEAVRQDAANGSAPLTVEFVIYNLPNRDCSALASNGELLISENGLARYKTEYIDPIAQIMSDSKYANLRIVTVVEIDSLPNLLTNTNLPKCAEAQSSGAYVQGIQYALNKLHAIKNVYTYLDAAHHGWIGWDTNFGPSADLMASTARGTTAGYASVDGFITNTSNYSALSEPYFNINTTVNGTTVRQSKWVDWNYYVDELTFAQAFRNRLIQAGFPSTIGMLIDTSRNGWGGSARPTRASTSTVLDTFVNESRIDRRIHPGNWCNQSGAGMGERPKASPAAGLDAYVWIKPPGESDGASSQIANDEGKGFDRMCDPTYTGNDRNGNNLTGALPNAPLSGHWFSAQFQQLMQNAYPPLS
ncbi:glycoside hydrolase family 6 protein [Microbispora sp. RL4-1S]|uniref:Glucanase n=1 Tax=Microbispora oryzae TaxID=2806554 RepID=A0A940WCT0_9ACTN|nr:glycoside hydrolase family 6 protein [Microbispora oryzae]MBP2703081.1 glycoside hydrolase family 6 protein [Microbispora oryzae]